MFQKSCPKKRQLLTRYRQMGPIKSPPKKIKSACWPNSRCVCITHCEILHDDKLRALRHFCWLLQGGSQPDLRHVEKFTIMYKMTVIKKESERQSDFSQTNCNFCGNLFWSKIDYLVDFVGVPMQYVPEAQIDRCSQGRTVSNQHFPGKPTFLSER